MSDHRVRVAGVDEIPQGEMRGVSAEDEEILVARVGDSFFAIGNMCTHVGAWLDMGKLHPESLEVQCPLHRGRFDLRTGKATVAPCIDPVRSYPVIVVGDDVFVDLEEP